METKVFTTIIDALDFISEQMKLGNELKVNTTIDKYNNIYYIVSYEG